MPVPIIAVADVVRALQMAKGNPNDPERPDWGRAVLLVGAGCSVSAGIPSGRDIVADAVIDLVSKYSNGNHEEKDPVKALDWLKEKKDKGGFDSAATLQNAYGTLFGSYHKDPLDQQEVIRSAIQKGDGQINWAHLCIGELVHRGYVSTVLTTNFDQLVLEGIIRTGLIPVVADGVESLARISGRPNRPQVIHLHGSMHTYNLRNSTDDVKAYATSAQAITAVTELLRDSRLFLVVGYAGGEEGVMTLLKEALRGLPNKTIYWVQHSAREVPDSPSAEELLGMTRNGGLLHDQDADTFLYAVMQGLGLGVPYWVREPVDYHRRRAERISIPKENPDVADEIERYKAELLQLSECLARDRSARKPAEVANEKSRRLRLAGEFVGAFDALNDASETVPAYEWRQLGESALDAGRVSAHSSTLETAKLAFERAVQEIDRIQQPIEWAETTYNIAETLYVLGEREEGTIRLEEAVTAYRSTLIVYSREDSPIDWAAIQNDIGIGLNLIGQREEGVARLEEAVAAYRLALEVYDRDRLPLDWAMTQNNLGDALCALGERQGGTVGLREAVAAYRAALEIYARDQVPLDWAMTQNNLGDTLRILGEREEDTTRLEEAVAALRAALEVRTRESMPLDWATTQNSLGNALSRIGEREEATTRLEEAATSYRAALEVYTRDRWPLDWAMTQSNLGDTLRTLGEREEGMARLQEAVSSFRAALEVYTRDRSPLDWAMTQNSLGNALGLMGEREEGTTHLREAIAVYRAALEVYTRDQLPLDWAMVQNNLGDTLRILGEREENVTQLEEAIAALKAALEVRTRETMPLDWAITQNNLGNTLSSFGVREKNVVRLDAAKVAYQAALDVYEQSNASYYAAQTRENLAEVQELLEQQGQK